MGAARSRRTREHNISFHTRSYLDEAIDFESAGVVSKAALTTISPQLLPVPLHGKGKKLPTRSFACNRTKKLDSELHGMQQDQRGRPFRERYSMSMAAAVALRAPKSWAPMYGAATSNLSLIFDIVT